jgi:hypothetical protein
MSGLVRETAIAPRAALLRATRFLLSSRLLLPRGLLLHLRRCLRASWGRTMGRDMAATNPAGTAAPPLTTFFLGQSGGKRY